MTALQEERKSYELCSCIGRGRGQRFGGGQISKQFAELIGVPMIVYSLLTAEKNNNIDAVCVVVAETEEENVKRWAREYGISKLKYYARPGKERQQSVFHGLQEIPAKPRDTVMIMTSVCPFVSQRTINQHYEKIRKYDATITVVKATDAVTFSNDGKRAGRTLQKKNSIFNRGHRCFGMGHYFWATRCIWRMMSTAGWM